MIPTPTSLRYLLFTALTLFSVATAHALRPDALAAQTSTSEALTGPLNTVTIASNNLQLSRLFYQQGLGMQLRGPVALSAAQQRQLSQFWQIPTDLDWQLYYLAREGKGNTTIRLIVFQQTQLASHSSWLPDELGPLSLGFPSTRQTELDQQLRKLGFGSRNAQQIYSLPGLDGEDYRIFETVFNGPDFVHAVLIERGDDMPQVGPVAAEGIGGPAYSAIILHDQGQTRAFLTEVLGMEVRSQRQWQSSGEGALGLAKGTRFDFSIVYSQGANSGHLLLLELLNRPGIDTGIKPELPNRGIVMWSFPVQDMARVIANAKAFGSEILSGPTRMDSPQWGPVEVMLLRSPNGLPVEIYSTAAE